MNTWRLLITPPARGAWNMALDEAILEHIRRGAAPATLRLYAWDPPCLSLGQAQPFKDVDTASLRAHGWELVRRATGGRAILHTDELTYSVTAPADEPAVAGSVLESYNRLAQGLLAGVRILGLPVEMQEPAQISGGNGSSASNPVCFEVPSTYEITVQGRKLVGSAQARKKDGVLQHGSLPLGGDLSRICQALAFPDEGQRQQAAERLLARAATVESVLGHAVDWDTAAQAFVQGFESQLGMCFERVELSASEASRTGELVAQKYANRLWTERV